MSKNSISMNDAFFKIFKHRVTGSFAASSGHKKGHLLFKEQVDLLQKTEQFIQEIRDGLWDENLLRELFIEPVDLKEIAQICTTLNGFRFQASLINNPILERNFNFKKLLKIYKGLDSDLSVELQRDILLEDQHNGLLNSFDKRKIEIEFNKQAFVYSHSSDQSPSWGVENFPLERIIKLISIIRNQSQDWLNETLEATNSTSRKFHYETKLLNALLEEHKNLYVLVVDIRFVNYLSNPNILQEEDFWISCTPFVQATRILLEQLSGSVYGYSQVESDLRSGLILHCILYFKYDQKFNERRIIKELETKLLIQFPSLQNIEIRNWNNVIRKHYSTYAVGHIKNNNIEQVEAVEQWVLNYYLKINDYLWITFQRPFDITEQKHFRQMTVNLKEAIIANQKMLKNIKTNAIPLLEIDEKSTWSTRHLPKEAKERINLSNLYYRALDKATSKNLNYLEIFIETILDSPFCAFDLKNNDLESTEFTVPILNKALTRIGRQFISLSEHDVLPEDSLLYHQLFSKKIKFQIVHDFKQLVASRNVTQLNIHDLNTYIGIFRDFLNRPFEELGEQSIASYRINQNNLYKGRLATTTRYLKNLLRKDVKTFHLKFHVSLKDREIKQAEFSKLMNSFLHDAKRAKPLYWMAGYLGFWRYSHVDQPYAEIIFFLDERCFGVGDDEIISLLIARWEKYLDKQYKPPTIKILPDETIPSRESRRLWRTSIEIDSEPSILIESINKERQKKLLTEIIPEFIVDCTFQEKPCEKATKALIKGKMPTKKQQVSKKDLSGTDEPQDT